MAPPLYGDDVEFADGHSAELEEISKDVAAFLMWTAEPKMMARKQAGFTGVLMLGVLTVLLYLTNKRIWAPVKRAGQGRACGIALHRQAHSERVLSGRVSRVWAPACRGRRAGIESPHEPQHLRTCLPRHHLG